mgnify:CR=1 FL=1
MSTINFAAREINCKIVYYGPGMCGKTTNLKHVFGKVPGHLRGEMTCVFGCGGERDAGKRPQMAAIAEAQADRVIVTDDNPRRENGDAIVADILAGIGGVGMGALQGALNAGARNIFAVDPVEWKRDQALKFGATHAYPDIGAAMMGVAETTQVQRARVDTEVAIALVNGEEPKTTSTSRDDTGGRDVPSVLLTPKSVTKDNIGIVFDDGGQSKEEVCAGQFAAMCTAAGA